MAKIIIAAYEANTPNKINLKSSFSSFNSTCIEFQIQGLVGLRFRLN